MRLTILGCGTSSGVPRIGGDWGACDRLEPRNRRTRASILVEADGTTILVDTGPDLRAQLLAAEVGRVDAVIWTHEHADHTHGIDDLRQVYHLRGSPIPGFARPATRAMLEDRFHYVFHGRNFYPPSATLADLPDALTIGGIDVAVVDQPHGRITSAGLRFSHGGHSIGYATDFSVMTPEMRSFYDGVDIWVVDALRREPHPTHAHLSAVLAERDAMTQPPVRTLLTHMDQSMDFARLCEELPQGTSPAYDGLELTIF